jgi:hypothetical protein
MTINWTYSAVRHVKNGKCWSVEDHGFNDAGEHVLTRRTTKGRYGKTVVTFYDQNDNVVEGVNVD